MREDFDVAPVMERVVEDLSNLDTSDLVNIYNEYAEANNYNRIESMSEFDDYHRGMSPSEIARMVSESEDFDIDDDYFYEDDWGDIKSFTDWNDYDSPIDDLDELADFLFENDLEVAGVDFTYLVDEDD